MKMLRVIAGGVGVIACVAAFSGGSVRAAEDFGKAGADAFEAQAQSQVAELSSALAGQASSWEEREFWETVWVLTPHGNYVKASAEIIVEAAQRRLKILLNPPAHIPLVRGCPELEPALTLLDIERRNPGFLTGEASMAWPEFEAMRKSFVQMQKKYRHENFFNGKRTSLAVRGRATWVAHPEKSRIGKPVDPAELWSGLEIAESALRVVLNKPAADGGFHYGRGAPMGGRDFKCDSKVSSALTLLHIQIAYPGLLFGEIAQPAQWKSWDEVISLARELREKKLKF